MISKVFSERLKALRSEKNLSQKAVADEIGIVDRQYRRYEAGEQDPATSVTTQLADLYGVSLDYLVGRTDDPNGGYQPPVDSQEAQQ